MAGNAHLAPDFSHDALAVDQKGRTVDAHIFPSVKGLFDPGSVSLNDLSSLIRGERHLQPVFGFEFIVFCDAVLRDADNLDSKTAERPRLRSEVERFFRAAGRVVLRVEIENKRRSREISKRRLAAAVRRQIKSGRFRALNNLFLVCRHDNSRLRPIT